MNLFPHPRSLQKRPGIFLLPRHAGVQLDDALPDELSKAILPRLRQAVRVFGVHLETANPTNDQRSARSQLKCVAIRAQLHLDPERIRPQGYLMLIDRRGVSIEFRDFGGLHAAIATLRQLLLEYGRRLPQLKIRDWPDFPRRGVMLDISRGRVPKLETLLDLAEKLADFKVNELQLYVEHTFAYRDHQAVWKNWSALTAHEIKALDSRCRELGIDLVPNQNSFGHLREWLAQPALKHLAEVATPYESATGDFLRRPSTLAPTHPGTLPFLRKLYDGLLPNFSSRCFNVGCDETWDLGLGRSKSLCKRLGKGRVYLDFLKQIHREVAARDKQMMFWGDIILHHPHLIHELPRDAVALNWGYEADHPFEREAAQFAKSKIPFYVCPGTSTWMTLTGRHDNAFANLRHAARAGLKHGARGYLITDWGDGGHPQPLAVSWLPFAYGAGQAWCGKTFSETKLAKRLSRDVFGDTTESTVRVALALGFAHLKFSYKETNQTPFGATIAAPPPQKREMFCRNGLKYYARITSKNVRAALAAVERQITKLTSLRSAPGRKANDHAQVLKTELLLAARMAAESCRIMIWQQTLAAGKKTAARKLAAEGILRLRALDREFNAYWPSRNKGTPRRCSPFLKWRTHDYQQGVLHFPLETARIQHPKFYPAE